MAPARPNSSQSYAKCVTLAIGKVAIAVTIVAALIILLVMARNPSDPRRNGLLVSLQTRSLGNAPPQSLEQSVDEAPMSLHQWFTSTMRWRRYEESDPAMARLLANRGTVAGLSGSAMSLERQNQVVKEGLSRAESAAEENNALHFNEETNLEIVEARAQALADMMGIKPPPSVGEVPPGAPRDLSAARARRSADIVEAIRGCASLECLKVAHTRPRAEGTFNFPHFFIIGWQKTATTSLFAHLARHAQVSRPWDKEPEFFSNKCAYNIPQGCQPEASWDYIQRVLRAPRYCGYEGRLATFEASTHYSRNGHLMATSLYEAMPWVKIVMSLREPISRAASMLVHLVDRNVSTDVGPGGCLAANSMDLGHCLLTYSHIHGDEWGGPTEYAKPFRAWLEAFPREQMFVTQYENLTSSSDVEQAELARMKSFLGINPRKPAGQWASLGLHNSRKERINPDGWPMKRDVYQRIIDLVRGDCDAIADMLDKYELGNGRAWMTNWERVWQNNLNSCDEQGNCMIQLS